MNIKKTVNDIMSSEEIPGGLKLEVIMFLERYSSKARPLSHYSCHGRSKDVIIEMLENLGFTSPSDFTVETSRLDPDFHQIRWPFEKGSRISGLTSTLVSLTTGHPSLLEVMYARVQSGIGISDLIDMFPEPVEETADSTVALPYHDPNHPVMKIAEATRRMASSLLSYDEESNGKCPIETIRNGKLTWSTAIEYLKKAFNKDGSVKDEDLAPLVLPVSVLEAYEHFVSEDITGTGSVYHESTVFMTSDKCIDLFRVVGKDDHLPWAGMMEMPLIDQWNTGLGSESDENPLHGYFFSRMKDMEGSILEQRNGLFVACNSAIIHGEDAEDNVTPALIVAKSPNLWKYIMCLYRNAYELEVGLTSRSRIGVSYTGEKIWDGFLYSSEAYDVDQDWISCGGVPVMAEYGLFIGKGISDDFLRPNEFMRINPKPTITEIDDSGKNCFSSSNLAKDELPGEWFAMTHMSSRGMGTERDVSQIMDPEQENSRFQKFRETLKGMSNDSIGTLSSVVNNEMFKCSTENTGDSFTPISAFVEGLCLTLYGSRANGQMLDIPTRVLSEHVGTSYDGALITNIYSGMFTDLSPEFWGGDGEVFPKIRMDGGFTIGEYPSYFTDEESAKMTGFLSRLKNGSMEQMRMSKRTPGTPRYHALIVETNVDYEKFMPSVDSMSAFEADLGTLFIQTIMLRGNRRDCVYTSAARRSSECNMRCRCHKVMATRGSKIWESEFPDTSMYDRCGEFIGPLFRGSYIPGNLEHNSGYLKVRVRKDTHGRMVLLFVANGDMVSYSRFAFRFENGFPLESAVIKEKIMSSTEGLTVKIPSGDWKNMKAADRLLNMAIKWGCDASGIGNPVPTGGNVGPMFREGALRENPMSRDWYISVGAGNTNSGMTTSRVFINAENPF